MEAICGWEIIEAISDYGWEKSPREMVLNYHGGLSRLVEHC